ncbi:MAG: transcriptional regulator [Myxococcales bacterium]|nr:transcriptional regulator [Myxococcales bacterium]
MSSLSALVVAAAEGRALALPADADRVLAEHLAAGRARVPDAALDDAGYCAHVAARLPDDDPAALARLRGADLFLAAALAHGDPAALAVFEREIVPDVMRGLARARLDAADALQALRVHLFVGARPRIADYGGHGDLRAWVRISAARMAVRAAGRTRRELPLDAAVIDHWADPAPDPARAQLQGDLRAQLERAVAAALATLDSRARNLLRHTVLDGVTLDELAGLYRVHRATAARWLADARDRIARQTRRELVAALRLRPTELDSALRAIDSQLELSLTRLLRETPPP